MFESERIEYKSQEVSGIYKEVIAFANTEGGIIYIGIDNDGNLKGLENVDETYTSITNGIRDAIAPDVTMFIRYILQDNNIIRIEVGEGTNKPYYLKSKGMKPNGVFIRQGASSVPASSEQIRQMIKKSDGDDFEKMRSLIQELDFSYAKSVFKRYGVEFSEDKHLALGIKNLNDDMYTNLALLISDECQHTTKIAVFADQENTIFKDSKEFSGSILRQLDESYEYLELCNRVKSEFKGLERVEKPDYPHEALREALLNSIVHRDYSFSGSIIINVNDKCMEFISIGGLLPGLTEEDIKNGISQPRNKNLAEIFHRLRLIESYGTGIRRVLSLYKNCRIKPEIIVTPNTFKLILPNMNEQDEFIIKEDAIEYGKTPVVLTKQMEIIIDYLSEYGNINEDDLMELLQVKKTRAYTLARQMTEMGLISAEGRGANKKYKLK